MQSVAERYVSVHDAAMQLDRAVVMTDNYGPIYLDQWDEWMFRINPLTADGLKRLEKDFEGEEFFDIRNIGINFEPLELGYVNFPKKNTAHYLMREPRRMWKAGLTSENVFSRTVPSLEEMRKILTSPSLGNTLLNTYPSFKKAVEKVLTNSAISAFHRDFAVSTQNTGGGLVGMELLYKETSVATVLPDGDLELDPDYFFLKELIEEVIFNGKEKDGS